jgi:glycosyltransferase involved in cell wall biosynthesis
VQTARLRASRAPAAGPLRVLFVSDHLGFANGAVHGVTTYFLETLAAFARARVEPALCILQPHHPAAARFAAAGLPPPIFLGHSKWDPRAFGNLLRLVRASKVDVLHLSGEKSLLLGRLVARRLGLPVVAHVHDTLPAPRLVRALQRRLAAATEVVLANSRPVREFVIRELKLLPERVQVLHYGLGLERFARPAADARPRLRAELGLAPATPTAILVGRVHPVKGQQAMIRALPRVLQQCPETVLVIVGEGPDRAACAALARQQGLGGRVRFTGQRDDIPDLLAAADVAVVPSLWQEPFGLVALEAMAAGRPVVAFRTGGLPESIVDGETGFLVAPGDETGLADAVARVLARPELAGRLGAAAARRAQAFSIRSHVERLEELYGELHRGSRACRRCGAVPPAATERFPLHPAERS